MGSSNTGTVMTIANSIIGVSVLAMPFCFKECGIILSILMLVLSSILSRLTCYLLLKAAVLARRRNFEFLAFHIFGPTGKFLAELCIIGFLMGTCIAFFVVVGDLGPAIISKTLDINDFSAALRPSVLIGVALIVVLPLGLLRNVDSLSNICTATIGFYLCLVIKVALEALPHLLSGVWLEKVNLWRPAGVLQCLPIFSMALFCQTQLFEIYDSLPNASLERMNGAVRSAINLCAGVYISVGFFGYVAFCTQPFGGNILMSFSPTAMSEIMKLGFVLSVAVSFPLVIFPCRASLYSLLFRRIQFPPYNEPANTFIPEARFKCITVFIIACSLIIGLVIPNIELVLGLVGSTIGVGICVMFPALAFLFVSVKDTADRLIAQLLLFVGLSILVLGTYATISAAAHKVDVASPINLPQRVDIPPHVDIAPHVEVAIPLEVKLPEVKDNLEPVKEVTRKEPPVPVDPVADDIQEKSKVESMNLSEEKAKAEVINKDALKKEDEELAQANVENEQMKKEVNLLKTLEKHKEEQNKLLEEQREIIQKLKEEKVESKKQKEEVESKKQKEEVESKKQKEEVESKKEKDEEEKEVESTKEVVIDSKKEIVDIRKQKIDGEKEDMIETNIEKEIETKKKEIESKREEKIERKDEEVKFESNKEHKVEIKNENEIVKQPLLVAPLNDDVKALNNVAQAQSSQRPIAYQQRYHQKPLVSDDPPLKLVQVDDTKMVHRDILETLGREKRDAAVDCPLPMDPLVVLQAVVLNDIKPMARDLKSVDKVVKSEGASVNETEAIK